MLETYKKKCPVCGEEFTYIDMRNEPATCYKVMCRTNWNSYNNRMTSGGDKPDLKEMGIWGPSRDYKRSVKSQAKK